LSISNELTKDPNFSSTKQYTCLLVPVMRQ